MLAASLSPQLREVLAPREAGEARPPAYLGDAAAAAAALRAEGVVVRGRKTVLVPYATRWPVTGGERNLAFYAHGLAELGVDVAIFAPGQSAISELYASRGIATISPQAIEVPERHRDAFLRTARRLKALLDEAMAAGGDATARAPLAGVAALVDTLDALAGESQAPVDPQSVRIGSAYELASRVVQYRRLVAREQVEVIVADWMGDAVAATLATTGTSARLVWYCQMTQAEPGDAFATLYPPDQADAFVATHAEVVTCGEGVRRARFGGHARTQVVPNGVNAQRFCPAAAGACRLGEAERDQGRHPLIIANVAYLAPRKNQRAIVEAAIAAQQTLGDFYLLFFGGFHAEEAAAYRGELMELAAAHGMEDRLLFLGVRDDLERILPHVDVFVFPSTLEGLPLAVLEAMASGVPAVISDVDGCRELAGDGVSFFAPQRPDVLAAHLARLAAQPQLRRHQGAAARRQDEQGHFTQVAMLRAMARLLDGPPAGH